MKARILAPNGIDLVVEGPGRDRVVGLAAEVEGGHEAVVEVFGPLDVHLAEVVAQALLDVGRGHAQGAGQIVEPALGQFAAVAGEEVLGELDVEAGRIEMVKLFGSALLPSGR